MNVSKKIFDYYAVEDENIEVGMNNFFNNLMFQFSFFLELGQFDSIRYKSTTVLEYFLVWLAVLQGWASLKVWDNLISLLKLKMDEITGAELLLPKLNNFISFNLHFNTKKSHLNIVYYWEMYEISWILADYNLKSKNSLKRGDMRNLIQTCWNWI